MRCVITPDFMVHELVLKKQTQEMIRLHKGFSPIVPAVSHIRSLTLFPSNTRVLTLKSTPIVARWEPSNCPSTKFNKILVFPTPVQVYYFQKVPLFFSILSKNLTDFSTQQYCHGELPYKLF